MALSSRPMVERAKPKTSWLVRLSGIPQNATSSLKLEAGQYPMLAN
jgi:hypothetical protein